MNATLRNLIGAILLIVTVGGTSCAALLQSASADAAPASASRPA